MSPPQRALIALALVIGLLVAVIMTSAAAPATPERSDEAMRSLALAAQEVTPTATPAPPTATPIPPTPTLARRFVLEDASPKIAPTSFLPGRGPELPGEFVHAGRRLDFYVGRGTFSADEVATLAVKAEHALGYIQKRFAEKLSQRISVGVYAASQAPGRGTRGIAYTHGDTNVRIYYRPGEDQHDALCILVHELAHALQADTYGKDVQSRADNILLEGLASWIAGEYWLSLSGAPSFHARARELYQAGYTGNLATMDRHNLDVAYDMWAGFVDYLTRTYGWDKFNLLYQTGRGRAEGSADYMGVYGKSFKELAAEYYETLK